jgi:hypothetical protein
MVKTVLNICQQLLQPRAAHAAVVLAASVAFTSLGCSKADNHVPVYPVTGKIQYQGKPINGAFVTLEPKTHVEGVPGSRATVQADGTFAVTTFNGGDGAPAGEYTLAVQWSKPILRNNEYVGSPNLLPAKYASPKTSGLIVSVAAGENQLKPIVLR